MGALLAVHGVAEGWILAVGSPLGFIFWLWLGRLADVANETQEAAAFNRHFNRSYIPRFANMRKDTAMARQADGGNRI
jgi:hypothetical protein